MSVPAETPPGGGGPGRLKPLGSVVVVVGVIAVAFAVAACVMPKAAPAGTGTATDPAPARQADFARSEPAAVRNVTRTIVYSLLGEGGARNLTYVGAEAGLEQLAEVATPWSVTITRTAPAGEAGFASLAAQSGGSSGLTCRITVDGAVVAEKSVAGEGTQLSCSA